MAEHFDKELFEVNINTELHSKLENSSLLLRASLHEKQINTLLTPCVFVRISRWSDALEDPSFFLSPMFHRWTTEAFEADEDLASALHLGVQTNRSASGAMFSATDTP